MSDEATTKPTLETLSKQLENLRSEMLGGFAFIKERLSSMERRLDIVETQLVNMDIRLDRIEGFFHGVQSEVKYLRADFKEFRSQFKAPA